MLPYSTNCLLSFALLSGFYPLRELDLLGSYLSNTVAGTILTLAFGCNNRRFCWPRSLVFVFVFVSVFRFPVLCSSYIQMSLLETNEGQFIERLVSTSFRSHFIDHKLRNKLMHILNGNHRKVYGQNYSFLKKWRNTSKYYKYNDNSASHHYVDNFTPSHNSCFAQRFCHSYHSDVQMYPVSNSREIPQTKIIRTGNTSECSEIPQLLAACRGNTSSGSQTHQSKTGYYGNTSSQSEIHPTRNCYIHAYNYNISVAEARLGNAQSDNFLHESVDNHFVMSPDTMLKCEYMHAHPTPPNTLSIV